MALLNDARQATWLRQHLLDLGFCQSLPTTVFNGNNAAVLLGKNPVNHNRAKHINITITWIKRWPTGSSIPRSLSDT